MKQPCHLQGQPDIGEPRTHGDLPAVVSKRERCPEAVINYIIINARRFPFKTNLLFLAFDDCCLYEHLIDNL